MGALPRTESDSLRLLLVDDDPVVRMAIAKLIERRLGVEVTPAFGAIHALSLLRRSRFDGLVVDLDMPEMSGNELLSRVASLFPEVVCGVWSGRAAAEDLSGTHARFVIDKSEPVGALLDALSDALDVDRNHSGLHTLPPKDA